MLNVTSPELEDTFGFQFQSNNFKKKNFLALQITDSGNKEIFNFSNYNNNQITALCNQHYS